jgi:two-component system, cell cycle response regulator DivK
MSIRVLVVEDNVDSRKLLVRWLSEEGFHGEAVESAEEALIRLGQARFDIVLMDVRLPRMDGKEAVQRIRANPTLRDLPIVAVSAHVVGAQRDQILASGVSALVTKPIDFDELQATIRRLLPDKEPKIALEFGMPR